MWIEIRDEGGNLENKLFMKSIKKMITKYLDDGCEIESYGDHESEGITRVIRGSRVKKRRSRECTGDHESEGITRVITRIDS